MATGHGSMTAVTFGDFVQLEDRMPVAAPARRLWELEFDLHALQSLVRRWRVRPDHDGTGFHAYEPDPARSATTPRIRQIAALKAAGYSPWSPKPVDRTSSCLYGARLVILGSVSPILSSARGGTQRLRNPSQTGPSCVRTNIARSSQDMAATSADCSAGVDQPSN